MTAICTLAALLAAATAAPSSVSVAYAGSLIRVMEGPLAAALLRQTGVQFQGEGKGSKALANLIAAGLRTPDVFISADPALIDPLVSSRLVRKYTIFGSARMVIAYAPNSPHRSLFEEAAQGKVSVLGALTAAGVQVGRTDPQLDPKGARTERVIAMLGKHDRDTARAARLLQAAQVFPEEDLAVRVESGELDAGFLYSTEIPPGGTLRTVELPAGTNLNGEITYALCILQKAPHPAAAATFADFLLRGGGKAVLEQAGVSYFAKPKVVVFN